MSMSTREARQEIKRIIPCTQFLKKSRKSGMYECIYCGSGTKKNGTGAMDYYDDNTVYCYSCMNNGTEKPADVIDVYRQVYGVDDAAAMNALAEMAGITLDRETPSEAARAAEPTPAVQTTPAPTQSEIEANTDEIQGNTPGKYKEYCERCMNDADKTDYFKQRGLSAETIKRFKLGFDVEKNAVVIPYNPEYSYYITRRVDEKQYRKPSTDDAGPEPLYNPASLFTGEPVFVCEGVFDALSIIEAGGNACAVVGTGSEKLIKRIEKNRPTAPIILFFDNDEAGEIATERTEPKIEQLRLPYIKATFDLDLYAGDHKDANEMLLTNRAQLVKDVERNKAAARSATRPDSTLKYLDKVFKKDVNAFKVETKTGFDNLDEMSGGLYGGLYVIAATSSLGKTTFCVQLADQIAAAGRDVLYFSLEQSKFEIVSKSLARIIAQTALATGDEPKDLYKLPTSLDIRKGRQGWLADSAAETYKEQVADRVNVIEGNFDCDLDFIKSYVTEYMHQNLNRPILVIDYLQIVQPKAEPGGHRPPLREGIDGIITGLKRFSRDRNLTIILICSVNRTNYLTPIDFESLKESGGIEYTADVVWGLQFACLTDDSLFQEEKKTVEKREKLKQAKRREPRQIELVCLKNRFGLSGGSCRFDYYAAHDLFLSADDFKPVDKESFKKSK